MGDSFWSALYVSEEKRRNTQEGVCNSQWKQEIYQSWLITLGLQGIVVLKLSLCLP
jgi:hypothetical protein